MENLLDEDELECLCALHGGVFCNGCPVHDPPRSQRSELTRRVQGDPDYPRLQAALDAAWIAKKRADEEYRLRDLAIQRLYDKHAP